MTRWITSVVAVMLAVLVFAALSSTALGAEVKRGDQVDVPVATTIDGDLYIFSRRAEIFGTVAGDVTAATAFFNSVGSISGDLTVASGRAEVRGPVGGDVLGLGASIAIYGEIEGNVTIAGGVVTLVEGAEVHGDLVILGGQVEIIKDATVEGELHGAGLSISVEGHVLGDLDLIVRRLHLAPGAQVDGTLRYLSAHESRLETGALVTGAIEHREAAELLPFGSVLLWEGGALPRLLAMIFVGGVLLLLVPRGVVATADRFRVAPLESSLVGMALGLLVPVLLVLLALTVIGLPLALVGAALLTCALYMSQAVVGLGLGRWLVRLPMHDARRGLNLAVMSFGVLAISCLRLIPVAFINVTVGVATAAVGLGAIALALSGSRQFDTERKGKTNPLLSSILVIVGCLLGSLVFGGVLVTIGAGVLWLLATLSSTSTSTGLTLAFERDYLALVAVAALTITLGASAIALTIYRRL